MTTSDEISCSIDQRFYFFRGNLQRCLCWEKKPVSFDRKDSVKINHKRTRKKKHRADDGLEWMSREMAFSNKTTAITDGISHSFDPRFD